MVGSRKSIAVLFQEINSGSESSFNELFLAYYAKLSDFALQFVKQPVIAEEIASELFVKIWMRRDSLHTVLNPVTYLYVSVKNAALNYCRDSARMQVVSFDDSGLHTWPEQSYEDVHVEQNELFLKLNEAIEALPDQRRMIFRMVKEDGLKCREVAEILNLSTRTVENQVYNAVKTLAEIMSRYLGYDPRNPAGGKQLFSVFPFYLFF